MWIQIRLLSDLGPYSLSVFKHRFEKFARIFSRRHKQTTFSDADFLGVLRVKVKVVGHMITCVSLANVIKPALDEIQVSLFIVALFVSL